VAVTMNGSDVACSNPAATEIGLLLHLITPVNGAALISAGLLSVVIFPLVALGLLRGEEAPDEPEPAPAMAVSADAVAGKPM
jgi:hypothetical protein